MKGEIPEKIRAAGGEIYAVTSEPQALASRAQSEWDFGFESVGDPHQEIAGACRERGWLDLFVNEKTGLLLRSTTGWLPQHPKGYFQPGTLALSSSGRVLYRWRGTPTRKNIGGATERPTAEHVWAVVSEALQAPADTPDAALDADPPLDSRGIPWPLFVILLLANGWFVRARPFLYLPDGPTANRRARSAMVRVAFFLAGWVAAFATLPTLWVGAALAAWVAWIIPSIRVINDECQNEPAPKTSVSEVRVA